MSINVEFTGNLGSDIQIKEVNSTTLVNFSICHHDRYEKNGQTIEDANWIDVELWGDAADRAIDLDIRKGSFVRVRGVLKQARWQSLDGSSRSKHFVRAFEVTSLEQEQPAQPQPAPARSLQRQSTTKAKAKPATRQAKELAEIGF